MFDFGGLFMPKTDSALSKDVLETAAYVESRGQLMDPFTTDAEQARVYRMA